MYTRPWSHSGLFILAYCYSDTNFCQFIANCTRIKSLCISKGIVCKKITGLKFLNLIFWIISNCIFFYSLFFRIFFVEGSSFQRIMAMCNRQLVFDKLRPLCVQLSKDHSRKNVVAVTKALEGIDRGCIQDLQEYLLFPLRIILKQPTK